MENQKKEEIEKIMMSKLLDLEEKLDIIGNMIYNEIVLKKEKKSKEIKKENNNKKENIKMKEID